MSAAPAARRLVVDDVMTQEVLAVAPDTSLSALTEVFLRHGIAGAPVIDESGKPIGVVTSSDLIDASRRSMAAGQPTYFRMWRGDVREVAVSHESVLPIDGVVADVMSHAMLTVDRRASVRDAAQLMARADVHRLIVTERGRVVGIVTTMDCLKVLAGAAEA
jgi:predicted transcriptional regulator